MATNSATVEAGIFPRGFSESTAFPWPLVPSRSIIELVYGDGLTEKTRKAGSIPVYGTNGRCGWHDTPLTKGPGVILGRKGMGHLGVEWCDSDFWVIDTAYYVRPRVPDIDLKFLYYLVNYIGLDHLKDGTSNPSLTRDTFGCLLLPHPPLNIQRSIARILTGFDHKIELNQRTNETLEAMARALFKSWFIDFDPVRAKAAGLKTNDFPSDFESSSLGEIPRGWKVGVIADIASLSRDSVNPGMYADETFCHLSIPSFDDGQRPTIELGSSIKSNKFLVAPTAVLLSKLNPRIPRIWLPDLSTSYRAISSTEFLVLLPASDVSREYLYMLFSSDLFLTEFSSLVTGTSGSHQRVRPENLLAMRALIPPAIIVEHFTRLVKPILDRIATNRHESSTLAASRDALLPKLLSGEIKIKDA